VLGGITDVGAVAGFAFLSFLGFFASRPALFLFPMTRTLRRVGPSGQEAIEGEFGKVVGLAVRRHLPALCGGQVGA